LARGRKRTANTKEVVTASGRLIPSDERRGQKVRVTFHLSAELINEVRDVVVALSGPPDRLMLSDFAESALRREVARLKRIHLSGGAFAKRAQGVRRGRPIR